MKIKFGIEKGELIPQPVESNAPMKVGDRVFHYNHELHQAYVVKEARYIVDDLKKEFYQEVSLSIEGNKKE